MEKGMYVSVFVLVAMVACVVQGCTKLEVGARLTDSSESDQRKIYYTEVIVYGNIVKQVTGRKYPNRGVSGVFNVEFEVSCVYLGGDIPDKIFISGMGNDADQLPGCPPAPIDKSQGAVMFLKRTNDAKIFEVEFKPNYGPAYLILDDLSINCGLSMNETRYPECRDYPPLSVQDMCVQYTTTPAPISRTTPVPTPTKKTPVVVDGNTGKGNQKDEGYQTNVDASKDDTNKDKMTDPEDKENGAVIQTGSLVACLSTLILILFRVL